MNRSLSRSRSSDALEGRISLFARIAILHFTPPHPIPFPPHSWGPKGACDYLIQWPTVYLQRINSRIRSVQYETVGDHSHMTSPKYLDFWMMVPLSHSHNFSALSFALRVLLPPSTVDVICKWYLGRRKRGGFLLPFSSCLN